MAGAMLGQMYRLECRNKESRASSVLMGLSHHISEPDLWLKASDGVTLPSHRCLLTLASPFVASVLASLPCCLSPSISLPFTGTVLKNLLHVLSSGSSFSLSREDALNVNIAANMLGIKFTNLEATQSKHLRVTDTTIQDLFHKVTGLPRPPKLTPKPPKRKAEEPVPFSPMKPAYQNGHTNSDVVEVNDDDSEVMEITPEIFGGGDEYAPHFLMAEQYGEPTTEDFSARDGWMEDSTAGSANRSYQEPELQEIGDGEDKRYKCSFCPNKEFKKKPEVQRHMKKHIPLSQRKRFQCEGCKEKFISNSNLKTHMKVCTGQVKIWTCKRCKAEYDNKTDYEDHLAEAHNTGRKHECSICHKQLRRAGDVRKHMLTHSQGKPFGCDICGKKFSTESYVKIHRRNHGQGEEGEPRSESDVHAFTEEDIQFDGEVHDLNEDAVDDVQLNGVGEEDVLLNREGYPSGDENIHINGEAISTEEEDTENDPEVMAPDSNEGGLTHDEDTSEAVSTPESGRISTPESDIMIMDQDDQEVMGKFEQTSLLT